MINSLNLSYFRICLIYYFRSMDFMELLILDTEFMMIFTQKNIPQVMNITAQSKLNRLVVMMHMQMFQQTTVISKTPMVHFIMKHLLQ